VPYPIRSVGVGAHIRSVGRELVGDKLLKSVTNGQCDARPTVTFPAAEHHRPCPRFQIAGLLLSDRGTRVCEQLAQSSGPD